MGDTIKRKCPACNRKKLLHLFGKSSTRKNGVAVYCKSCYKKKNKTTHKERIKNRQLKYSFGIPIEEYKDLFFKQGNKCGICGVFDAKKYCVDHDHKTNKIRGILCGNCNTGIGMLKDDYNFINKAYKYILKHQIKNKRENPQTIIFDIDGCICHTSVIPMKDPDYKNAKPIYEVIEKVNKLYSLGHIIGFYSSRGVGTGLNWFELTIKQLEEWGILYDFVRLDKPEFDVFIDDKALHINDLDKIWEMSGIL